MLSSALNQSCNSGSGTSVSSIITAVGQSECFRLLFDQIIRLLMLLLTVPASAATAERSFSSLHRMKNYMRATMTQRRLTNLLMLYVHKSEAKKLSLLDIAKEFIQRTTERVSTFGIPK